MRRAAPTSSCFAATTRRAPVRRWASEVLLLAPFAITALTTFATPARAQERPTPAPTLELPSPPRAPIEVSPGGAFLRALLVPGWGHVAIGSDARGGVYFAVQSATAYTLLRTRARIGEVQDRVRVREGLLRAELAAQGITDPAAVEGAFDADQPLGELRDLLGARKEQQEDLVAFGLFVLFLSGADAYVSAHLARFPEPLEVEGRPSPDGGFEVGLRLGLPR